MNINEKYFKRNYIMITVGKLIKELQQFDPNMEVIIPEKYYEDKSITFTSEFEISESSFFDPSVEGEESWAVELVPPRFYEDEE
jgi:hypothetical protein